MSSLTIGLTGRVASSNRERRGGMKRTGLVGLGALALLAGCIPPPAPGESGTTSTTVATTTSTTTTVQPPPVTTGAPTSGTQCGTKYGQTATWEHVTIVI